jgi:hypothetical protein
MSLNFLCLLRHIAGVPGEQQVRLVRRLPAAAHAARASPIAVSEFEAERQREVLSVRLK